VISVRIGLFLLAVQYISAQPFIFKENSLSKLTFSSSYFDFYRSTNSSTTTSSFLSKTTIGYEGNFNKHYVAVTLVKEENVVSIENKSSLINFKGGQNVYNFSSAYEYSVKPFFFEGSGKLNLLRKKTLFDYGGYIGFKDTTQWISLFGVGYFRSSYPWLFNLKYLDSGMDLNNLTQLDKIFYKFSITPVKGYSIDFTYEKYLPVKNKNENSHFSVEDNSTGFTSNTVFKTSIASVPVELNYNYGEGRNSYAIYYSGNTFSSNAIPEILMNSISVKTFNSANILWLPQIFISYDYYKAAMVGNIQSWPFTSFFTSFIANRLNYRLVGHLYLFSLEAKKAIHFEHFSIQPEAGLYQFLPEITLDSWQPSYLVFGVKDFVRNNVPIRKALMGKVSVEFTYTFNDFVLQLDGGQYFPIKIVKKESVSTAGAPTSSSSPTTATKSDGGRWITLKIQRSL